MSNVMSGALDALMNKKATLNHIEVDPKKAAIETHEPLVIAVVPPTVGKLSVLLRRIDYMTSSGIDYDKIVVISPTEADVDDMSATNRFTGNMTADAFIARINGKYPIRYKNIIINGIHDEMADNLNEIMRFISENRQSLFIVNGQSDSEILKEFIDCGAFTVYNL